MKIIHFIKTLWSTDYLSFTKSVKLSLPLHFSKVHIMNEKGLLYNGLFLGRCIVQLFQRCMFQNSQSSVFLRLSLVLVVDFKSQFDCQWTFQNVSNKYNHTYSDFVLRYKNIHLIIWCAYNGHHK